MYPQGLELFKEEHGRYPDLVVLHSNYWDVAQIVMFREWDAPEWNYVNTLQTWLANADKVASFLKVRRSTPVQSHPRHNTHRKGSSGSQVLLLNQCAVLGRSVCPSLQQCVTLTVGFPGGLDAQQCSAVGSGSMAEELCSSRSLIIATIQVC